MKLLADGVQRGDDLADAFLLTAVNAAARALTGFPGWADGALPPPTCRPWSARELDNHLLASATAAPTRLAADGTDPAAA